MAVLLAGLPTSVPGSTTNRLCGSGIDAAIQASRAIETGDASIVIAGGVESMSRAPYVMLKPDKPFPGANETLVSTHIGWRFTNPKMPDRVVDLERPERRTARREVQHHPRSSGCLRPAVSPTCGRRLGCRNLHRRDRSRAGGRRRDRRVDPRRHHPRSTRRR